MRSVPNMIVAAPMNEVELRNMMYTAQLGKYGPFSIRYPRGRGQLVDWKKSFEELKPGKGRRLRDGSDVVILSVGATGNLVQETLKKIESASASIAHYDMRYVKPLDTDILHTVFKKFDKVITIEDGTLMGGFGSAVLEFMCDHQYSAQVKRLGIPDEFIEHGTQAELYKECGFDPDSILSAIRSFVKPGMLFNVG
jgi:1-deoxy-D-xylulose-5-phosphate synthase